MRYLFLVTVCWSLFQASGNFDSQMTSNGLPQTIPGDTLMDLGKRIFYTTCYTCHKDSLSTLRAPGQSVLSSMNPRAIFASLDKGKMRQQAIHLTVLERKAVAQWLTQTIIKESPLSPEAFQKFLPSENLKSVYDYSGWGGNNEATGFRTARQSGISAANIGTLKLKWAFAFPDATVVRCKPAVAGDWIIVGGQYGDLYAIHRNTGKIGWTFMATAAIRGAITVIKDGPAITAYFADYSTNVYAVNVKTGRLIWNSRAGYEPHSAVTGSVAVYGGRIFVPITSTEIASTYNGKYDCCISSGGLVALDAKTGKILWHHRVVPTAKVSGKKKNGKPIYGPSGAPVWSSPTVDSKRGLVYIGTGENYSRPATQTSDAIQAVDMKTGRLVWNFQGTGNDAWNLACPYLNNCPENPGPDFDFGMAPILVRTRDGIDMLVAGQKSGFVYALNPGTGKPIWKTKIGKGGALGGIHWGMATDGKYAYAANADNINGMNPKDTAGKPSPGIYALDLINGKIVWVSPAVECAGQKNCIVANSAAPAAIPGFVFAGGLDGHIRAYSSADGKIVWDFDTAREFETSSGIKGKGGALDGPAPVIYDGVLLVNSGYGMFSQMPGNLLLAFEVDGSK